MLNTQKILIVEDDPSINDLLSDFLSDEGYQVTPRSNGRAALAELQKDSYDLMLLDMGLPDMTGNDVLQQMMKQALETPVIVVSANANQLQFREKVQAVVNKPFDLGQLLDAIQRSACSREKETSQN
jgi:DNA-binding response OmpR family regulator